MTYNLFSRLLPAACTRHSARPKQRALARRRAFFEKLEDRSLLATLTWVGDIDGNWNAGTSGVNTNWNTNTLPTTNDTLIFPAGAANLTQTNDTAVNNSYILNFTGSGYTIGGNAITLNVAGTDISDSAGGNALNTPLVIATSAISVTTGTLTLGGAFTGAGGLTKSSAGTLAIGAAGGGAGFGTTAIAASGGVVSLFNSAGLGAVTIASAGVFEINNTVIHNAAVTLSNGGTLRGVGAARENGIVTIPAANANVTIAGASGADTLTMGDLAADLTGAFANITINVNAGNVIFGFANATLGTAASVPRWNITGGATLRIAAETSLGIAPTTAVANAITLNNGTIRPTATVTLDAERRITIGPGAATIDTTNGSFINNTSPISGSGVINILGVVGQSAQFNNLSAANPATAINVQSGRLFVTVQNDLGAAPVTVSNGAQLGFFAAGSATFTNAITLADGADLNNRNVTTGITFSGPLTLPTAGSVLFGNEAVAQGVSQFTNAGNALVQTGDLTVTVGPGVAPASGVVVLNHPISGGFGLIKAGVGDLSLLGGGAANTFGSATINAGRLIFNNQNALGAAPIAINNTGTLTYAGPASTNLAPANTITMASGGNITNRTTTATLTLPNATFILPTTGTVSFNNDAVATSPITVQRDVVTTGTFTIQVGGGTGAPGDVTWTGAISGSGPLTKSGPGVLNLNTAATHAGTTTIANGTLRSGVNNVLPTGQGLVMGSGATVGTLDLTNANQTVTTLNVSSNSASNNQIIIGSGRTLTTTGNVLVGINPGNATTRLVVTGDVAGNGTWNASSASAGNAFQVGGNTTDSLSNAATLDMSNLGTFSANLTNGTGTFRVGDATNGTGTATLASTVILAQNSTITATTITSDSPDSGVTQTIRLGSGTNDLRADSINIGGTVAGRSNGVLNFNSATGTIRIRNKANAAGAALNIAHGATGTGANITASVDFTGHNTSVDGVLLTSLSIGGRTTTTATGSATGTFSFDTGSLTIGTLTLATRTATAGAANGTLNIGGGTVSITGAVVIAQNNAAVAGTGTSIGVVNITGGSTTLTGGITLANRTAAATAGNATGTLNITGGSLSVAGGIVSAGPTARTVTTLQLDGGTLDMNGNDIGSTTVDSAIDTLQFEGGTLDSVDDINNTAGLTKTTTGTLNLIGVNNYEGATVIDGGRLNVGTAVAGSLTDTSSVAVNNTGTLGGTGSIVSNAPVTVNNGGTIDPGLVLSPGQLAVGSQNFDAGSALVVKIDGTTPGDGAGFYSQLNVVGTVALNTTPPGVTLNVDDIGAFDINNAAMERYVIVNNDGGDAVTGEFAGLPDGSKITLTTGYLFLTYSGDSTNALIRGNDIILSTQPVIMGGAGADRVTVTSIDAAGNIQVDYSLNGGPVMSYITTTPPTSFVFNGGGGNDELILILGSSGIVSNAFPTVTFDGEAGSDSMSVIGTGIETATYLSHPTIANSGTVTVAGITTITFSNLAPVDMFSMATANVNFANSNDVVTIAQGFGATVPTSADAALVVSGTSNLLAFESVHLRNNGLINLNTVTSGVDGNDTITITGAANAHGNDRIVITTGVGTDTVTVNGALTVDTDGGAAVDIQFDTQNIILNAGLAATGGTVILDANTGAITSPGANPTDVTTTTLSMEATTGIGAAPNPINTAVSNLEAETSTGGIFVSNTGDLTIGGVSGTLDGVVVNGVSGAVSIVNAGSIDIINGVDAVSGPTNVTVDANGATADVQTAGSLDAIVSAAGNINIEAGRDVLLGDSVLGFGDVESGGSLLIDAGRDVILADNTFVRSFNGGTNTVTTGRDVILIEFSLITSESGVIDIQAGRDVSVGSTSVIESNVDENFVAVPGADISITAGTNTLDLDAGDILVDGSILAGIGDVSLFANEGAIADGNLNLTTRVQGASLVATAANGIGALAQGLETAVGTLSAKNTTAGHIIIDNDVDGLLVLDNISPVTLGFAVLNTAPSGQIVITNDGALQVSDDVQAPNAVSLEADDNVAVGDNLTIDAGAEVESTGFAVFLEAGDNMDIFGDVSAADSVNIAVDRDDAESPAVTDATTGGTLTITGVISTTNGTFIEGNDDHDTFDFDPQTTTQFNLDGFDPTGTITGDVLIMDVTGATNPTLVVPGTTAPYTGVGSGHWTFPGVGQPRDVLFTDIEDSQITGNYHLTYDNGVNPVGTLVVMRNLAMDKVQIRDTTVAGTVLFQGDLTVILSLSILGNPLGDDTVIVDDINTLPDFAGTVPLVTDNLNSLALETAEFLFDGQGGPNFDTLIFNINGASASQSYAIGDGVANGGFEGEISSTSDAITLVSYFQNVELAQRTGNAGLTPGGLTVIGDSFDNSIAVQVGLLDPTYTGVEAAGYTPFEFSGNNYLNSPDAGLTVNGLGGADTISLYAFGTGQTNGMAIVFNGDAGNDGLIVQGTSGQTGLVTLNGNAGSDLFYLGDGNTVDSIVAQVVVDGTDANTGGLTDRLIIVDSGDPDAIPTGDNVLIDAVDPMTTEDYQIEGITSTAVSDVIFRNVVTLDYTGTAGDDTIDGQFVATTPGHDLDFVTLNGWTGGDQFKLFTSDQYGGTNPADNSVVLPPTPAMASGVLRVNLNGDSPGNPNTGDGNDIFGELPPNYMFPGVPGTFVPGDQRGLRPSRSTIIAVDGGRPTPLVPPTSDQPGDIINLDVSGLPANAIMILGTLATNPSVTSLSFIGGSPPTVASLTYRDIEDLNLIDKDPTQPSASPINGILTNAQIGGFYARGTATGNDQIEFYTTGTGSPNSARVTAGPTTTPSQYQNFYSIPGRAVVYGGGGNDIIRAYSYAAHDMEFYGEDGNDQLYGHSGNDKLVGGRGNDSIQSNGGNDIIWGDRDPVEVGLPDDVPNRSLLASDTPGAVGGYHPLGFTYGDVIVSGDGNDVIYGGPGDDGYGAVINAGNGDDVLYGGHGNDNMDAGAGNDRVYGGDGGDVLSGNTGDDLVAGNAGNDALYGKAGNDVLIGGAGNDQLFGEDGNDLLYSGYLQFPDTVAPPGTTGFDGSRSVGDANDVAMAALLADWATPTLPSNKLDAPTPVYVNKDLATEVDKLYGGTGNDCFVKGLNDINGDAPERTNPFAP